LADLDAGCDHPFGQPTGYELVYAGKRYPPKAVVGLAFRHARGHVLGPDEFSGGEAPGQANHVLRQLRFTVVKKGARAVDEEGQAGQDWTEAEVRLIVADYFEMLRKEQYGQRFSKAAHRKALRARLAGRSDGSVEFKHQNISAALVGLGLPYLGGYKPRSNLQALLAREVEAFLDRNPALLQQLADAPLTNPAGGPKTDGLDPSRVVEEPPERLLIPRDPGQPWLSRKARRVNLAEREAANRRLGRMGEEFVVWLERQRLRAAGRGDLAGKVEHVAETVGDGLGFDVLSFEEADDSEKLVEVKTTVWGKFFPFYVTGTELRCSEATGDQFHLFRVFDFARSPRLFILRGSLREACGLEPTLFRATP
jgi:hypothetical protein